MAAAAAIVISALVVPRLLAPDREEGHPGTLRNPIDRKQQTALAFGERSHWLQPWRAYLDTPPATRLRDAIGINFNVRPKDAEATAALLQRSGFRRARLEIGWDQIAYGHPDELARHEALHPLLGALRRHGIRPLILLNANHGAPGPIRRFSAELAAPANAGAREVRLAPDSAKRVEPGRSGLNSVGKAADVIFTDVRPDGTAAVSKPLPQALPVGPIEAATLRYPPFGPPRLPDGRPNPRFERTLDGWLRYVRTVVREARAELGSQEFDVEVWNEMTFGSDFLFQERYYEPPRETGEGDVTRAILERTVRELRGPGSPAPEVGIGDGFANQTPFASGSTSPKGLTAIDKHPYYGLKRFPRGQLLNDVAALDARGRPNFTARRGPGGRVIRRDRFVPRYDAFFPEYILTGIQTENLIRDLSPFTTDINGTTHGRNTHPPGGPPPRVWVSETNLDPTGADPAIPGRERGPLDELDRDDVQHLHAKAALRYYVSFVNKGVSAVDLYAVNDPNLGLVQPGDPTGGDTPRAVKRLVSSLAGAEPLARTRPLSLLSVSDEEGNSQFDGDGTLLHPPLRDRDVTAFFPFQVRPGRYVAAAYVMTRNLAKRYGDGDDPGRYDLPEAPFRLTIGQVDGERVKAKATDPLHDEESVPVKVVARRTDRVTIELPLTDSPRMITLSTD
jgi:hypothetical protein